MKFNERIHMTEHDDIIFSEAQTCYLCNEEFEEEGCLSTVRDHDHRTGAYRGATHSKCNINYFSNRYLPVVCHNLRGYDSHLIIEQIYQLYPNKDIQAIPNNYEKFMSFKIGGLKILIVFNLWLLVLRS
jgi:hypothetical protein